MENKELIKSFIANVKDGKTSEAQKSVERLLYTYAGNAVKELKKKTVKEVFNKK